MPFLWITFPLAVLVLLGALWLRRGVPRDDGERLRRIERYYGLCAKLLPKVPEVSAAELVERIKHERLAIVDVREPHEQAVSMIPGAISRTEFEARKDDFRNIPIIAYCTLGFRSGKFAARLRDEGLDAYNLRGAILAWTHTGQPLVDAEGETRRVHVYGRKWNLVASGYEGVW
ncbi:MAG TPA: rhodanese-like domain-containing protein [Pirellulales bacterium]|nr:rhodanese-like domain-containing protein [Pirellulales bacterium]